VELVKYLQKNIKYPEILQKDGFTGAAFINFIIDENGKATNITCQHTTHPLFSAEAIRVIEKMPRWKPGRQGGKNVRVIMTLPVTFRLL
jgi:protein TonB